MSPLKDIREGARPSPISKTLKGIKIGVIKETAELHPDFSQGGKPLIPIIFSHGYSAISQFYSCILKDLASHGYLVFAINHRDGSAMFTKDKVGGGFLYFDNS